MYRVARLARWGLVLALGLLPMHSAWAQQQQDGTSSYNWSGFYGGGNIGGAWGGSDFLSGVGRGVPFFEGEFYPNSNAATTARIMDAYRENDVSFTSLTGGLQVGYNIWTGGVLIGFEADINFLNANKSTTRSVYGDAGIPNPAVPAALYTFRNEIDVDYVATLRSRVGVPVGSGIAYLTGGVALTTIKYQHDFVGSGGFFGTAAFGNTPITEHASVSEMKVGYVIGGGFELPVGPNASLKTEYLFTDFGNVDSRGNKISPLGGVTPDVACGVDTGQAQAGGIFVGVVGPAGTPTPRQCFKHKADFFLHSVRLGLNFKF
jgi:outer membrane immunogenic protein